MNSTSEKVPILDSTTERHESPADRFSALSPSDPPFMWAISQQYTSSQAVAFGYPYLTSDSAEAEQDEISQFLLGIDLMLYAAIGGFVICLSAIILAM